MTTETLEGIHFMLPTPFRDDGEVDVKPYRRLVGKAREAGCRGVVCLGVMGEAHRLTDSERQRVVDAVVQEATNGTRSTGSVQDPSIGSGPRLSVTVGVSSESSHIAAARAQEAQQSGAASVMVAPPRMGKPNDQVLFGYYAAVDAAISIPLVIQDLPQETGVHMSPEFIARLNGELPHARYLKLEDSPSPPKITRVLKLTGAKLGVFGGLGGSFLFEELRRGAIGTMTGFAYPEVLVEINRRHSEGDVEGARATFYRWMPLIRYENQSGIGLSIRKHVMKMRGLIDCALVRSPGPNIDEPTKAELEDLMRSMGLP